MITGQSKRERSHGLKHHDFVFYISQDALLLNEGIQKT